MSELNHALAQLQNNLAQVVKTQPSTLKWLLVSLLCRGHLLLEDVPGVGKTTLARALAQSLAVKMQRVQCTPDLMPSDITGISIFNNQEQKFQFIPGPIFTNILLADEINRATPRCQSALLEAMAEGRVTYDRKTYPLPNTFMVIATQNPMEFSGTYALPEAQLDRFFMRISLGYPTEEQEIALMLAQQHGHPLQQIQAVMNEAQLQALQALCQRVVISEPMLRYIGQIVRATRTHAKVRLGASPRGSLALMQAARALALLSGKKAVTPQMIPELLEPVLAHRMQYRDNQLLDASARSAFWQQLVESIPVPDFPVAQPTA